MRPRSSVLVVLLLIGGLLALSLTQPMASGEGATGAGASAPRVTTAAVAVSIDNSYAVTHVEEVLENPGSVSASASFSFQVPEEAFISNFSLCINGTSYYGKVVPAGKAQESYNESVAKGQNAGLLAAGRGRSLFTFSTSLKAGQNVTVGLVFEQYLRMKGGRYTYTLCLDNNTFGGARPSLEVLSNINYTAAVSDVTVGNYSQQTVVRRLSAYSVRTVYASGAFVPCGNYEIQYAVARPPSAGRVNSFYDGKDTYFLHAFDPDPSELGGGAMPKQIVFVLDRSGSMSGNKIAQVKDAFEGILGQLGPEDEFSMVYFSSYVSVWQDSMLAANRTNTGSAAAQMRSLAADGMTDFHGAVEKALELIRAKELAAPIVVLLTDGQPTAGITDTAQIRRDAILANTGSAPVYCLGFGNDVDFDFLKALSLESGGKAQRIYLDRDASDQIREFYSTVSEPVMKCVDFEYAPYAEAHVLGGAYLYEGSELLVAGRMAGKADSLSVKVTGVARDGNHTFNQSFIMDNSTTAPMAPRFWTFAHLNSLLDKITVEGPMSAYVQVVTDLAVREGFVTPYTSMYVGVQEPQAEEPKAPQQPQTNPVIPAPAGDPLVPVGSGAADPTQAGTSAPSATPPTADPAPVPDKEGRPLGNTTPFGAEFLPIALAAALLFLAFRRRSFGRDKAQ